VDAEGHDVAEALLRESFGDERLAEELALQAVRERLRQHVGTRHTSRWLRLGSLSHLDILACPKAVARNCAGAACVSSPHPTR
jgi:hypothetical protein